MIKEIFQKTIIRTTVIVLFIFISNNCLGQQLIGNYTISNDEKNITNLSGKLNDSISFHVIINKVKKTQKYKSLVLFFDEKKQTKAFPEIITDDKPNYLLYHVNDNVLTTINEIGNGVKITDFDYVKETINSTDLRIDIKTIFSHKNLTYLTGPFMNNKLFIAKIASSNDVKKLIIKSNNSDEASLLYNLIRTKDCEFINDRQFIEKGSVKDYKGFYNNGNLVFLYDNKKESKLSIFTIDDNGNLTSKDLQFTQRQKTKRQTSFVKDSLLFSFNMKTDNACLNIYNFPDLQFLKEYRYNNSTFGKKNKLVKNGTEKTSNFKVNSFYKSFFSSIGSTYYPGLYLNVNKSKESNYIVEIGHVDRNTYQNTSANNFWWSSPAFASNYNLSSGQYASAFGIAGAQMMIFTAIAEHKSQGNYFIINLNNELDHLQDEQETEYYQLNTKLYKNRISNMFVLKNEYLIPLKNSVRLINYDKKSKSYKFYNLTKL